MSDTDVTPPFIVIAAAMFEKADKAMIASEAAKVAGQDVVAWALLGEASVWNQAARLLVGDPS